ncbi:MAG: VWA domain-containing protein [Anaerolineae bacterium]|nr:VWA domain-containing protein [Anaerolineae bacterium]
MGLFRKVFGTGKQPTEATKQPAKSDQAMRTLSPSVLVEPFAEINTWDLPNGGTRVRAYILMERPIEGMQTGVAIDGSASMKQPFGRLLVGQASEKDIEAYRRRGLVKLVHQDERNYNVWSETAVNELVARGVFRYSENIVEPQARRMTEYLSKFDADGGTTVIYWATGDGQQIEEAGDLSGAQCAQAHFAGPKHFGDETHLLPAIHYFVNRFKQSPWGLYIFITDGVLHDLPAVKRISILLAHDIADGKRPPLKFVLIGVGDEIDERQMEELDDLDVGVSVDLWDHKIAGEMKQLSEVFAEVVSESVIIAPGMGVIRDDKGNLIKDYRDTGLPALLWFDLPANTDAFVLEVGGQTVTQPVKE